MRCPCCESPLEHDVKRIVAELEAPIPRPSWNVLIGNLRAILDAEEARQAECALAPAYINLEPDVDEEDEPLGSDRR